MPPNRRHASAVRSAASQPQTAAFAPSARGCAVFEVERLPGRVSGARGGPGDAARGEEDEQEET